VSPREWWQQAGRWVGCSVVGAALLTVAPVSAQTPSGTQNMAFGTVLPGVPSVVARTDATRAGRFDVRGTRRAEVSILFVLPAAMTSGGASMPMVFGAGDGGYSANNNIAAATPFDPRVPLITRLGNSGRLYVFLGGTLQPSSQQASGAYTATIAMNVAYTGN